MENIWFRLLSFTLILLMLTSVFIAVQPSVIVHADVIELTFLTHWSDPRETGYWNGVFAKYEAENPNVHITMITVTFDLLLDEIKRRHQSHTDTDIISFYDMWLPLFANHVSEVLAPAPADVVADVNANWQSKSVEPSMYKSVLYGYPTELACWSLVYNRKLFQDAIDEEGKTQLQPILDKLEHRDADGVPDQPLSWVEFETAARALAKWDTSNGWPRIIQTGFYPIVVAAQGRFQFLSLLWSNGGEYYDLSVPEVLFDTPNAVEAMQLLWDLGYTEPRAYDPTPPWWPWSWEMWDDKAMMMLPTWMTYIRYSMGSNFNHLGVAPIPIGPSGTESVANSYGWMVGVSQEAQDEGRAEAAWDFLRWMNMLRSAGYIASPDYMGVAYGAVPKGSGCSIMGDWLIFDSIIPSKIGDQQNGHLTEGYYEGHGYDAGPLANDFWMKGFMDIANTYGRPSVDNLKSAQIDAEINLMFDRIIILGTSPATEVHEAALRVQAKLPMSGDVNLNGHVDIFDVPLLIADIDATPTSPNWHRGRSDFNDDGIVDVLDITALSTNYGKS